jgi:hypothetical protein
VIRLLADEDFNNDFVRGLLRRLPTADIIRVQDLGIQGSSDEAVLARAAGDGRVVLTHDLTTLVAQAYERIRSGIAMPGVIAVPQTLTAGQVIEDLELVVECASVDDLVNRVTYFPLR